MSCFSKAVQQMLAVAGSTSMNSTLDPQNLAAFAVDTKVIAGTHASVLESKPNALQVKWRAAVALDTTQQPELCVSPLSFPQMHPG